MTRGLVAAALLALAVTASCGTRVRLGSEEPPPVCEEAACGTMCMLPPCEGDAGKDCGSPETRAACDGKGRCIPGPASCPSPCEGKPCGEPCDPCPPDMPDCSMHQPGMAACDGDGRCVSPPQGCPCMGPGCPPLDPCAGKPCGEPCPKCDPMTDPDCTDPGPRVCNHQGKCADAKTTMCSPPPYEPCEQKACGDSCMICSPFDPMCVEPPGSKACDQMSQCQLEPVMCPP